MRIIDFVPPEGILPPLTATDAGGALRELAIALAGLNGADPRRVEALLLERESLSPTAIGHEIAVPHGKMQIPRTLGVLGISRKGVDFGAPDRLPVRLFVALLSPLHGGGHLKALAAVAQEFSDARVRGRLFEATAPAEIYALLIGSRGEPGPSSPPSK